jgi:hypothetical protein
MKKINLSEFKKKVDAESFKIVSKTVHNSSIDNVQLRQTSVNVQTILRNLPESEIKHKFASWASGYDFAIIDVM